MPDPGFHTLIVCTANVCRSPMAEYLLRDAVARRWGSHSSWRIESAGVRAEPGLEMDRQAQRALSKRGIDSSEFRSQQVRRGTVERADLILTAERSHRAAIVTLVPSAVHHTFTIRQFARLASQVARLESQDDTDALARQLLEAAANARSRLQPTAARDDDLPDPTGHRFGSFRRCAGQLSELVSAMLAPMDPAS